MAAGQPDADLAEAEQSVDLLVLGLVRAGRVAPGVAAALTEVDVEAPPDLGVQPFGDALGGLDADPVDEELLGELAIGLELGDPLGHLVADGHRLECDDVTLPGVERAVKVAQADAVVLRLAREDEPLDLAVVVLGVEDHELVAVRIAREVAELCAGVQVVLLAPHPLELRREALLAVVALDDLPPLLALLAPSAPVQLEEHVAVEVGEDIVEVDLDLAHAPEPRLGDWHVVARRGANAVVGG